MVTLPDVGGVRPTMTRMVVVLPAPLGPRNPVTVPGTQLKLMSSTAVKVPYFLVSPWTSIMAPPCRMGGRDRTVRAEGDPMTKVGAPRPTPGACAVPTSPPSLAGWTGRAPRSTSRRCGCGATRGGWSLMLSLSALAWLPAWQARGRLSHAWWIGDLALGAAMYVLVFYRRRWPVPVAVVTALAAGVSGFSAGPAVLAAASVATRRRWREIALVGSVNFAAAQFFSTITVDATTTRVWLLLIANAIATAAVLGWGMYIGSRRELIWTLRNRAERAEAEQELRVAQARSQEQARIAREMHDVLAHRISQISMHAGALAYRDDLTPEEVRASAEVIRDKAHEALTDLRGVLGVLRDGSTGELLLAPQPTYADLSVPRRTRRSSPGCGWSSRTWWRSRCRRQSAARSTGSCRRASPTPASTRRAHC